MATRREDTSTAASPPRRGGDTATRILDSAERLVQARGFNGFSYADVAAELGVTKASLHYHFPGKTELGQALMARYAERFAAALEQIEERGPAAPARLEAYADLYGDVLRGDRLCLCGMLAAEYGTLPDAIRERVIASSTRTSTGSSTCSSGGAPKAPCTSRGPRGTPPGSSSARSRARCWSRAPTATATGSTPPRAGCSRR